MGATITGKEYKLGKIFSSEFDYVIPDYQRPYAWTEDEAGILFDDLYDFFTSEPSDNNYFLGSIVLIKKETPLSRVVDGQQRLTTLTILMACLAFAGGETIRSLFKPYIIEEGKPLEGIQSRPRLKIRDRDNAFFEKYIQNIAIDELLKLDDTCQDTEAKQNIIKNAKKLVEKIGKAFDEPSQIMEFGRFLLTRCYLVAVYTSDFESAFRIFSVMNNRGMSLLMTDIFKSKLIGEIGSEKRNEYNQKWEDMEVDLGRNEFNDLFGQIRMIKLKTKPKKNIQEEYEKYIFTEINEDFAIKFIDNVLVPYADAYTIVTNSQYVASVGAEIVNDVLNWLNKIDNTDWLPVAMAFYVKEYNNSEKLYLFLKKLERLAAYLRISSADINQRIERYGLILSEIEDGNYSFEKTQLDLSDEEKLIFVKKLNGDIYAMPSKKRNYFILRLDSFIAAESARYDSKVLTIEHVLPQTVGQGSEWERLWPDEEQRHNWVHKIGNLIPLNKRHNSAAQNYDFDTKKEKYFRSKNGVVMYALATDVLNHSSWTQDVVEQRQSTLIQAYKRGWEL